MNEKNNTNETNDIVTVDEWMKWYFILFIPVLNIIKAVQWSKDESVKPSLRNAASAFVTLTKIAFSIWFACAMIALLISVIMM